MRGPAITGALMVAAVASMPAQQTNTDSPSWKRGGVCYEIFVRSFYDSDGDGIGDLNGLTQKLDYINDGDASTHRDLGARCVWLMPVAESPSYHGYDVSNYYKVEPDYGTNDDFRRFVAEAHRRGIHVLVDMVLNHASSEHPYFQEALRDSTSAYRSWFRFSRTQPDQKGPWGQVVWHKSPVRDEYYYGVFWSGMPDLNYDTPAVREEARKVARYWIEDMGVDGFRLDAVPYLVEAGTQLAGSKGTHDVLREYGAYVRRIAPQSFTVGEVWDSVGAMLPYYPDQLDSYFAFALSDALVNAVRSGSARGMLDGYLRLQSLLPADRWSPFLRNHDQTRTMTELRGDVAGAKVAATLLLTLPGLPFVYYGEEIGMTGDKPDERLRTPMQWSASAAAGFSSGKPWETLQGDSLSANVEAQNGDPGSLLNVYRALIQVRTSSDLVASGRLVPLAATSPAVTAYARKLGDRVAVVVANLSDGPLVLVQLSSAPGLLRAGRYAARPLVGGRSLATVSVGRDGAIRAWVPMTGLPPKQAFVVELTPLK
ncbi:MAG TPA: alpha-amylase family glycosyl hydrolase [Gemmatimonadaceae bacterium]|nr:alpha-amylase family glycosyl hydrolase [Gemmatimonadaceae bacterium]